MNSVSARFAKKCARGRGLAPGVGVRRRGWMAEAIGAYVAARENADETRHVGTAGTGQPSDPGRRRHRPDLGRGQRRRGEGHARRGAGRRHRRAGRRAGLPQLETFIGEVFDGPCPAGSRSPPSTPWAPSRQARRRRGSRASLEASLAAMRLSHVDRVLPAHQHLARRLRLRPRRRSPRASTRPAGPSMRARWSRRWSSLRPAAASAPGASPASACPTRSWRRWRTTPKPQVVQAIANLMDSPGALNRYSATPPPATPDHRRRQGRRRRRHGHPRGAGRGADQRHRTVPSRRTIPTASTMTAPRRSAPCAPSGARTRWRWRTATRSAFRASTRWCWLRTAWSSGNADAGAVGPLDAAQVAAIDALGLRQPA